MQINQEDRILLLRGVNFFQVTFYSQRHSSVGCLLSCVPLKLTCEINNYRVLQEY